MNISVVVRMRLRPLFQLVYVPSHIDFKFCSPVCHVGVLLITSISHRKKCIIKKKNQELYFYLYTQTVLY